MTRLLAGRLSILAGFLTLFCLAPAMAGEIRIGASLRMTTLQGQKSGEMLVDEVRMINDAGGIDGHTIKLILLNDECKPEKGVANAKRFIDQLRVHLIIGSTCSSVTTPILALTDKAKLPVLVPHSTSTAITQRKSPWVFRVAISSRFFMGAAAKHLADMGATRIAYVYTNNRLAQAETNSIIDYMKTRHDQEPAYLAQVHETELDFQNHLKRIRGTDPQVIYFGGPAESLARFLIQSYEAGISPEVIRAASSAASDRLVPQSAGDAARGVFFATVYSAADSRPIAKLFNRMVRERYGIYTPEHEFSQLYDTIRIAEIALRNTTLSLSDSQLEADRATIRDAIANIKDYQGLASGPISFCADPTPQCRDGNRTPVLVAYSRGGRNFSLNLLNRINLPADFGLHGQ